ncbi:MAG: DUF4445 domain-containing protein [Clostridia bacterium]|nr:DUF4445 domain-containing protein [Clostridia bacterium]
MCKIKINDEVLFAEKGELLSDILIRNGKSVEHPCGGRGTCRKCKVLVDGREELSCQYWVVGDVSVSLFTQGEIQSETGAEIKDEITDNMCFCLDIGTTTLALALVSLDTGNVLKVETSTNPQCIFGADVMTRIDYCRKNGIEKLQSVLVEKINEMIDDFNISKPLDMYVSANVTMLHTLFNVDCSSIGVSPYKADFLESKMEKGENIGLTKVGNVISLPSIHSFVGADIVAGMNYIGFPANEKYNLLVDLGTNAEIVLYSKNSAICTSAAAGPCFEGANISCGMSATDGAIYRFSRKNGQIEIDTINKKSPKGICGTGLVDIVADFLNNEIDETGFMEEDFRIYGNISLNQADVRQFQLAKSAVYSGIITLINLEKIDFDRIDKLYISGGFSAKINIENAVKVGLLPRRLKEKCIAINNSSLLGTVKFAYEKNNLNSYVENTEYVDLSTNLDFSEQFMKSMLFGSESDE